MQIAHDAELHFCPQVDAEGEIRTPEGLAAHQISSLARWTELRYLSASPSSEVRNTFSRALSARTSTARVRVRTPSRLDQRVRLEDAAKDLPEETNLATSSSLYSPAEIHRAPTDGNSPDPPSSVRSTHGVPPRLEPLASMGHRSNELPEVPAWVDHAKEPVDGGRHAGAVVYGIRSERRRLERGPLGRHDSGRAQDSSPCKGADDEADREEGRHVSQTIHLLVLSCAHGLKGLVVRESHAITTLGSTARRPRRAPWTPSGHRQSHAFAWKYGGEDLTRKGLVAH